MGSRAKLGELLVNAGVLDEYKLNAALAEQERWGGRLGRIIVNMNFLSEEAIVRALSEQLSIPLTELERLNVPDWITKKLSFDFVSANSLCPERVSEDGKVLTVAMSDPINVMAIDEIMHRTGLRVKTTLAGERSIERAINRVYGMETEALSGNISGNVFVNNSGDTLNRDGPAPVVELPASNIIPLGASVASASVSQEQTLDSSSDSSDVMASALSALSGSQQKQVKAIRAMVDLLIDKGVFSREEFLSRVKKG